MLNRKSILFSEYCIKALSQFNNIALRILTVDHYKNLLNTKLNVDLSLLMHIVNVKKDLMKNKLSVALSLTIPSYIR